jgi:release factor glutamine methyltransferase
MATVGDLLTDAVTRLRASGSDSPRLDAELLLARAIGTDRTGVIAHPEAPVGADAAAAFARDLARRESGEPVAYIRGLKEFHGIVLAADPRALIPRPETEMLVDAGASEVAERLGRGSAGAGGGRVRVADVGTGSGAVAIALAAALRRRRLLAGVEIVATDISPDAVALARENAAAHGLLDQIAVVEADLLPGGLGRMDVVLANLPYVASEVVAGLGGSVRFEPHLALDGGPDGLEVIRLLLVTLPWALAPGGVALLEIGSDQGESAPAAAVAELPGWPVRTAVDIAGLPRVLRVDRPAT